MACVHVGIIGARKHQLSLGVNYLCVLSDISLHLVRGAPVNDGALPYRNGLAIGKQTVHGADGSVQDY